jgi:RNA polymerase sigma factor
VDELKLREELLYRARDGDRAAREELVERHRHFILSVAAACCKKRITWSDDAASIALIAFNEAVDTYKDDRGVPFPAFARLVIRSRVADFYRKEARATAESLEQVAAIGGLAAAVATGRFAEEEVIRERREEIERYRKLLGEFGLSFKDLVAAAPKHRDARTNFLRVGRALAENQELFKQLIEKKRVPLTELSLVTGVPRKTLERGRRYVLAVSLIFGYPEEFTYLYSHLKYC